MRPFDLEGLQFQEPLWLWALLLGPLVLAVVLWRERRGAALAFPGLAAALQGSRGWRAGWRHLPLALFTVGLMLAAVAQARPQHGTVRQNVTTQGVDIVVALDVSGSMAAQDFKPRNRLEVAKDTVADFVKRRTSDRVGLVVFAGKALTKAPPTTDTAVLLRQIEDVKLDMLPDGTAIGSGLATSLGRLRRSKARSRVIVLVTDGANNAGEIDPTTATDIARAMQVRVYTILVGRGGEVPMPVTVQDPLTGRKYQQVMPVDVKIDEELLKKIATQTGADFFRAGDPDALRAVFEKVDSLERSEIKLTSYRRYRELYPPVLLAAASLLAGAGLCWASGLRVAPV